MVLARPRERSGARHARAVRHGAAGQARTLYNGRTSGATRQRHSGSIYEVGWGFQVFRINSLEMVGQTGIEPSPKGVSSD
jgi:hypothetical protein